MDDRTALADRAGFWGRVLALAIGVPIYFSLLATLPALAAVLVIGLYFGVPIAVRRAVEDPAYEAPSFQ